MIDPSRSWRLPALNTWISTKIFVSLRNCILPVCTLQTYVLQGKLCHPVAKCIRSPACVPSIQSCLILSLKDAKTPWWNLRTSLHCIVPRHLLPCSVITCWVLRKKQSAWGSEPCAFQDSAGSSGVNVTRDGDTARGQAFALCLRALSIHFSLLILWKGMLWRNTCLSVFHLCCSVSWGPTAAPVNTLNMSIFLSSQLLLTFNSKFPVLWAFWASEIPEPGELLQVQSARGRAQVDAQRSPWSLHHCSLGGGVPSMYCVSLGGWTVWNYSAWQAEQVRS